MKNVITISGDPGSGKSTVRNALKQKFEEQGKTVIVYSVGDIFRHLAEEKGMSIQEFNEFLQKNNCDIDKNIENTVKKFGDRIRNENDLNKIYIVDSRLAWMVIPDAFKVRLTTTDIIAGTRAFEDKTRGEEDRYDSLEEAIKATSKRKQSERERYKKLYGIDLCDETNYDLNINTSFVKPSEIVNVIIESMNKKNSNLYVCKNWASPKIFLPTQGQKDTFYGLEKITKSIEQNGYIQGNKIAENIAIIRKEGLFLISDGHRRVLGAARAGVNLIPYYLEKTDGKEENYKLETQIKILKSLLVFKPGYPSTLYDFEEAWRDKKTNRLLHTYDKVYPGIYEIKTKEQTNKKNEESR